MQKLSQFDWIVISVYGIGMLAVGFYYSVRTKSTEDYMLGGRKMKPWMVGLSLFATLVSAISYLSWPGEIIKHGPMMLCGILAFPLIYFITGWFVIPRIMKENVSSAYEFLEVKLGKNVRVLSSLFFLAMRLIWMAVIIYMVSEKIILPVMKWPASYAIWVSISLGLLTIIYTSMGGIRAVVVTDSIQSIILFAGSIVTIGIISYKMGGVAAWWPEQWDSQWAGFKFNYDTNARVTVLGAFTAYLGWYICTNGSDQMAIQRYLSTSNIRAARKSQFIALVSDMSVSLLLGLVGLCLLAFFKSNPQLLPTKWAVNANADQLFPHFLVVGLPAGVSGLVMAGLLAAAMSSLSSGVNSSALVICNDLTSSTNSSQQKQVKKAQIVSLLIGLIVIFLSTVVRNVSGNLLEVTYKTVNLLVAPLFVPFCIALYFKRGRSWPTAIGMILSAATACFIGYFKEITGKEGISFLWIIPLALLVGISASVVLSILPIKKYCFNREDIDE